MALVVNDRVKETSTTTGTGTLTLAGAVQGFETFSSAIGNTNTTYYSIVNANGEFEVGRGTVAAGTLARTTIISSSNSDSAVNFSAGIKDVFCTLPASKAVILDSSGNIVANNGSNLTALNATQLTSGTVPDARFPATLPAANGSALTALNATQLTSGTVPDARFPATLPAANGSALTNLNATNLASGSVASARLADDSVTLAKMAPGTDGNIISYDTSGDPVAVATGSAGQVLTSAGAGAVPSFQTPTVGDITAVTAGTGLTGGGSSGDVTLNVGAGTGVTVNANDIAIGQSVATSASPTFAGLTTTADINFGDDDKAIFGAGSDLQIYHDGSHSFIADEGTGQLTIKSNGAGIELQKGDSEYLARFKTDDAVELYYDNAKKFETVTGGATVTGTMTATTFSGSGASLTALNATNLGSGTVPTARLGTGTASSTTFLAGDQTYKTITADITAVTAGSGLTGGGSSGDVTLNIGAGTGIDVAADAISVDVSDFMANGSNNRVVTATGADAQNAEANMTFDGSTLVVTGAITATGDVTAFSTSDKNLKQNITNINNSLDKVSKINGVYYNWTKEALEKNEHLKDVKEVGVIAQEVEEVLPEIVATREDGTKAVKYERLCALLIESVKELKKEIELLKNPGA